ncbi:MAG: tetratricopeptide repeat protein [Pseudomonadota bacterium]|nr:tetratricopeptide repeat protein [Pseudomonadota bacterium]
MSCKTGAGGQALALIVLLAVAPACQSIKHDSKQERIIKSQLRIITNYLNAGMPAQSHQELRSALAKHPNNQDFLRLMGVTQLALNNPTKAILYLEKVQDLKPSIVHGLNLSSAYIAANQYADAKKLLLELLEHADDYQYKERLYHNLALIHERSRKWRTAEKYYLKALSENPSYYLSLLKLGILYQKHHRYKKAVKYLKRAQNFCRKCYEPVDHLAATYTQIKRPDLAIKELTTYSRLTGLEYQERQSAIARLKQLRR